MGSVLCTICYDDRLGSSVDTTSCVCAGQRSGDVPSTHNATENDNSDDSQHGADVPNVRPLLSDQLPGSEARGAVQWQVRGLRGD